MDELPLVSIVIPCLNEAKHIRDVLDSILAQRHPLDRMEVLIADGLSKDGTREIISEYSAKYPLIKLLDNPTKSESIGMNIGIRHSLGDIILRMDAHTTYDQDYISGCVEGLQKYDADIVGGIWKTVPQEDTLVGRTIAMAMSHRFGAGNARYRANIPTQPIYVDTLPYGAFRRTFFEKFGFFNERFHRGEDTELFHRVRKAGGKLLLDPHIVSYYRTRSSLKAFLRHTFQNGYLATYLIGLGRRISIRHYAPLGFLLTIVMFALLSTLNPFFLWLFALEIGLYLLADLWTSAQIARRNEDLTYLFAMPLTFFALHLTYGVGSLYGILKLALSPSQWMGGMDSKSGKLA